MGGIIRINRIVKRTSVEGFGLRYCIWVQGCSIRCPNCKNYAMWPFEEGEEMRTESVIQDIRMQNNIEGITVLGGEPLDQKKAVSDILKEVKALGLSTIVFTGYTYEKLITELDTDLKKVLKYTDLLIDGPFKQEERDFSRPWVGSKNQRYIFLSDRYDKKHLSSEQYKNKYEVRILPNGIIKLNGMGDFSVFNQIIQIHTEEQSIR